MNFLYSIENVELRVNAFRKLEVGMNIKSGTKSYDLNSLH